MSTYTGRVGQRIGALDVVADHGRTKRGEIIWMCLDNGTGRTRYLRSYEIARLAKRAGMPAPALTRREQ